MRCSCRRTAGRATSGGRWFQPKTNAVELARKQAHKVADQAVYISSVTDPYLPAERSRRLTRGILEAILPHQPRLLIQTRGPLVVRDADLFQSFLAVRVNLSLPTDDEAIRQAFEPKAPPLEQRWAALAALRQAGIPVGICVTPMLPLSNAAAFAARLLADLAQLGTSTLEFPEEFARSRLQSSLQKAVGTQAFGQL